MRFSASTKRGHRSGLVPSIFDHYDLGRGGRSIRLTCATRRSFPSLSPYTNRLFRRRRGGRACIPIRRTLPLNATLTLLRGCRGRCAAFFVRVIDRDHLRRTGPTHTVWCSCRVDTRIRRSRRAFLSLRLRRRRGSCDLWWWGRRGPCVQASPFPRCLIVSCPIPSVLLSDGWN